MKLVNTNRFYLPGTHALHLATIVDSVREYMCFYLDGHIYIEEITGGHLSFIEDDALAEAIHHFISSRGVLSSSKPLLQDKVWHKNEKQ